MKPATTFDHFAPCRWIAGVPTDTLDAAGLPHPIAALARYLHGQTASPTKIVATLRALLAHYVGRRGITWEVNLSELGLVGLRIGDVGWAVLLFEPAAEPEGIRVCQVCGCTKDLGCVGGCSWHSADLCTRCVEKMAGTWAARRQGGGSRG